MDEYASIRLMSFWATAITLPATIEKNASGANTAVSSSLNKSTDAASTLSAAAKAIFFVAPARSAATGGGAPWYASGTHM